MSDEAATPVPVWDLGDGTYVSKLHPTRAVQECLAGYALYEGEIVGGQVNANRFGVAQTFEDAESWLRGVPRENISYLEVVGPHGDPLP